MPEQFQDFIASAQPKLSLFYPIGSLVSKIWFISEYSPYTQEPTTFQKFKIL
jgi:hypothetical protein